MLDAKAMAAESDLERADALEQRLQRMLAGIERAGRNPNRREAYHIGVAIEHLRSGRLAESEEALGKAARVEPIPPDVGAQTAFNEVPTVAQLRMALKR
jgi:hypothetical protein